MDSNLIVSLIELFAQTQGDSRISEVERRLCSELGAAEIEFQDSAKQNIPRHTKLRNAVERACFVSVCFATRSSNGGSSQSVSPSSESMTPDEIPERLPSDPPSNTDDSKARFIRELHRLEANRKFMWAGFVVRELLPQMGFVGLEAKQFFSELEADGIVMISKEPNPNNPDHPTACVRLNAEHSQVKAALERSRGERTRIRARGEPVSETLIRERR